MSANYNHYIIYRIVSNDAIASLSQVFTDEFDSWYTWIEREQRQVRERERERTREKARQRMMHNKATAGYD